MTEKTQVARELRVRIAGSRKTADERRLRAAAPGLEFSKGSGRADFVMLPSEDYERLLDQADERGAATAFKRTRREEFVPVEIVDRLLARDNPIRVWREYRGLTLARLATEAGLSKGYLSDIENGKRKGTLATLRTIGKTLRVTVDDLA